MTNIGKFFDTRNVLYERMIDMLGGGSPARWHEVAVQLSTLPKLRTPTFLVTGTVIRRFENEYQINHQRARALIKWLDSTGRVTLEDLIWGLDKANLGLIAGEIQTELNKVPPVKPDVGMYTVDTIDLLAVVLTLAVPSITADLIRDGVMHPDTALRANREDALVLAGWIIQHQKDPKVWAAFMKASRAAGIVD